MIKGLLISCTLLFALSSHAEQAISCKEHQCITIIDAGSTGSRAHLYSYDLDSTNTPINIKEVWSKKNKPGFATLPADAQTVNNYLQTLLLDAPAQTPVYFYATAGMRLLPHSKQQSYYQMVKHWFAQQNQWQLKEAKTLTGREEALYDWLSVNYQLGTFKDVSTKPVGVLDMGGASVQIAFALSNTDDVEGDASQTQVQLYGQNYTLSLHSFLGLGQTELSHQFLNAESCFSNDYVLPSGKKGKGNAASCAEEIASLINGVHGVNKAIPTLIAHNPIASWYAMGGISYLADEAFHLEQESFTNQSLMEMADNQFCTQTWDKIAGQFPTDDFASGYCLFSSYYYALMVYGYGFSPDANIRYSAAKSNLDWTQGVVLHQM